MVLRKTYIFLWVILVSSTVFSQERDEYILFQKPGYVFPYDPYQPEKTYDLPKKLVEVSGLGFIDEERLACIQDEKGNIYIFNRTSGKVEKKIDFGGDADYEGVEIIHDDAWVMKSNGTLYRVKDFLNHDEPAVEKYTTELTGKNDAEGLGFDPVDSNLLIACKGHPFLKEEAGKEFKAIYNFSLARKKLDPVPFILIRMDTIKYYRNYNTMTRLGIELLAYLDGSKGDLSFQPSGIAVHPVTGHFYVIGSVGNLLIVFSRENEILAMVKLWSKYYPQPEGICFDPDGTLFISNEGDQDNGTILMLKPDDNLKP